MRVTKLLPDRIVLRQRAKFFLPLKVAITILHNQRRKIVVATFPKMTENKVGRHNLCDIRDTLPMGPPYGYPLILGHFEKSGNNNVATILFDLATTLLRARYFKLN